MKKTRKDKTYKTHTITILNKIEIVIYSIILVCLVLSVFGGIKSVLIHNMEIIDFVLYLWLCFVLFFLPIRYRLRKIFSMPPKELISTNLLTWSSIIIIIFCGFQTENIQKTIIQVIGILIMVYFIPSIVSKKRDITEKTKKDNKNEEEYGWQYWD